MQCYIRTFDCLHMFLSSFVFVLRVPAWTRLSQLCSQSSSAAAADSSSSSCTLTLAAHRHHPPSHTGPREDDFLRAVSVVLLQ